MVGRAAAEDWLPSARVLGLASRQRAPGSKPEQVLAEPGNRRQPVAQIQQPCESAGRSRVVRQAGHQAVLQGVAVTLLVMSEELYFHLGHVDPGGAFTPAPLAADA